MARRRLLGNESASSPHVFLSFASQDERHAALIAASLRRRGITVYKYSDESQRGDDRSETIQILNRELQRFTHFLYLLTPYSKDKFWPHTELIAALERTPDHLCDVLVLYRDLPRKAIPPMLMPYNPFPFNDENMGSSLEFLTSNITRQERS